MDPIRPSSRRRDTRDRCPSDCHRPHPGVVVWAPARRDYPVLGAVARADGVILRLIETIGGETTREAQATSYLPNAPIPDGTFDFEFPEGTAILY